MRRTMRAKLSRPPAFVASWLALFVLVAAIPPPRHEPTSEPRSAPVTLVADSRKSFSVTGKAKGLYPGATRPLRVVIANPNRFAIEVVSVRVKVKSDPARPECAARRHVKVPRFKGSLEVRSKSRRRLRMTIRMLDRAPDACQGARLPLRLRAKAVRP